jgi:glycosyltransferase involved in cell wall biosynthesis
MPRLLLVTMYFPPAAGGGVQRALKLATHLPELGIDTHVLTPDDAKWPQRDESEPLPTLAQVHRCRYVGPRVRLRGRELHGNRGLERIATEGRLLLRRLLVPDAATPWLLTAIPAALRIVRRRRIEAVLTTSPPDSLHLLGAAVQAATGARWIADLRESIEASPFRRREVRGEWLLARLVARRADAITVVAGPIGEELRRLRPRGPVEVIENGCDVEDFDGLAYRPAERFRITHTGSFLDFRDPRPFLAALARSSDGIVARFVGDFRPADLAYAEQLGVGDRLEVLRFVPRRQSLALQRDSEALLLLVADAAGRGHAVLTGKLFEYLAAGRPILAAAPPDGEAAALIRETGAGLVVAPDDVDGLAAALTDLERRWRASELAPSELPPALRHRFSRRAGAERMAALLNTVT